MKINQTIQNYNDNHYNPNFGFGDTALRFFATNQAIGANCIDLAAMVLPRTATDMCKRGPLAGLETLRREIMGTVNDSLIGVYGICAGAAIASLMRMNKRYGVQANKILAAPETVSILAQNKAKQIKDNSTQLEYLKETLRNLKGYNPNHKNADKDGFVKLSEDIINDVAKLLDDAVSDNATDFAKWSNKKTPNSKIVAMNKIIEATGAESKYILESSSVISNAEKVISETNLDRFTDDIYRLSDAFNKPDVIKEFKNQVKEGKSIADNAFIKHLRKFKKSKAICGFGMAALVGTLVQPINMYLTKRKTGSDGFVGVEGRTKDNSTGFKVLKIGTAAAFGTMVLGTLKTGLKGFMDKMAFHGFWPTVNQLKGVYGITIISRLLSARDKDELRESLTKDTLGFLSWLVLGDIVNRLVAEGIDKSVMNRTKEVEKQGFVKRAFNSTLKTRDEILMETLANNNKTTIVEKDGKKYSLQFREMLAESKKLPESVRKATRKQLRTLNAAQLTGYLFSGLVLGFGIPRINIAITNKLDKKRKEKMLAAQK
ncbi:MAG: hypothetical protein MJ237_04450 [bacterium]|nr:hypothetical protein [bacterium]